MHAIMTLYDQICDTKKDAQHFAECALMYKDSDRELADVYINLARADVDQCSRLHAQVVRLVAKRKSDNAEDKAIHELCEWHTAKLTNDIAEIKVLIEMYK